MTADPTIEHLLRAERERTVEQIEELTDEFDGIVLTLADDNNDDEHDPEGATVGFERARVRALLDRANDRLAAIDAAMSRLADDSFGRCATCGGDIGTDRLLAVPTTTVCVRCASR